MKSVFSKSPKLDPKGKKTLKEIEAELEAKTGADDPDNPYPSMVSEGGSSTAPWKTVVAEDFSVRYSKIVDN